VTNEEQTMTPRMTAMVFVAVLSLSACNRPSPSSAQGTTTAADASQVSPLAAVIPCGDLAKLSLPNTMITAAESVAAGAFVPPPLPRAPDWPTTSYGALPAFCRIGATVKPVAESEIRFEVWMPDRWNGKFAGIGNGGAAGFIFYESMADPLMRGYAVASSDTGHAGGLSDWSFAVDREKLIDHGYRATHEMTVASKAIIAARYGTPARQSYWSGCSEGGRQGLVEASRFPGDYTGIAAGAPVNNKVLEAARSVLLWQAMSDPAGGLTADKLALVREAALAGCDAADGLLDRTVTEPLKCQFDPGVLQCQTGDRRDCLTSRQVEWVRRIYRGVVNPRTGEQIYPGVVPTSEADWLPPPFASEMSMIGVNYFRDFVFRNPNWDPLSFDVGADIALARKLDSGVIAMTNPDLRAFAQRGGKLLLWHGWSDGAISPRNTIDYYDSVVATLGEAQASNHVRLFMAPGVQHCGGGEGAFLVDYLSVLEQWVEEDRTPERIIASRLLKAGATRTRPLCAYPSIAAYAGFGNSDNAGNFVCKAP
jgi:feruloyl esterase